MLRNVNQKHSFCWVTSLNKIFDFVWATKTMFLSSPGLLAKQSLAVGYTAYDLCTYRRNCSDPIVQQLFNKYPDESIQLLSGWWEKIGALNLADLDRFFAKQLSDFRGINSNKHKALLESIGFTVTNSVQWMSMILEAKVGAPIHSFSLVQDGFRITYEIPIPLDSIKSPAHQQGLAGHNINYSSLDCLGYTLVIEYKRDRLTGQHSKIGLPITGFLHDTPYNPRDERALLNPCKDAISWKSRLLDVNTYQQQMKTLQQTNKFHVPFIKPFRVLPLVNPTQKQKDAQKRANKALNSNKAVVRKDMIKLESNSAYPAQSYIEFRQYSYFTLVTFLKLLKTVYKIV